MGKKRVHELAKELGMDNREVVLALQAAGISVKTHSSSVYEEEALGVLHKVKEDPSAMPARRPGMVIVKKRRDVASEEGAVASKIVEGARSGLPSQPMQIPQVGEEALALRDVESGDVQPLSSSGLLPSEPPSLEDWASGAEKSSSLRSMEAAPQAPGMPGPSGELFKDGQAARVEQGAPMGLSSNPSASGDGGPTDLTSGGASSEPLTHAPHASEPVKPLRSVPGGRSKLPPAKATVVRMIDRDKLMERIPSRRLGGSPQRTGAPSRPSSSGRGGPSVSSVGSGVGPGASTHGKSTQRYGQVTELKVVTDPFGGGREIVAVGGGREKKSKGGLSSAPLGPSKAMPRKTRSPNKREMVEVRERTLHPARLKKKKAHKRAHTQAVVTLPKASKRVIKMKSSLAIRDLAHQLGIKAADVLRKLMDLGIMVTQNQSIDFDTAQVVASEFEYTVESVAFMEGDHIDIRPEAESGEDLRPRPPVVTVMGHVDHGKTSLLDAIRKARVAQGEAGGITQHIGAYSVSVPHKGSITFLDTPGHAAFTAMRARGAQVTDIVILVVAADDGVMPQTEEAIKHAQAAKVPIIVAVNKMDKPDANPERVMQELTTFSLVPEAWGGDTLYIHTSATQGIGIDDLLEAILLQAEVLDLKANPRRNAMGTVVEAQLSQGKGPVATVLVQQGTLKVGQAVVVGTWAGKVRVMVDAQGRQLQEAGPSSAVEISGLEGVPEAGDTLHGVETSEAAREVAKHRVELKRTQDQAAGAALTLEDLLQRMQMTGGLELKVVLKADVQGSVEALKNALMKLSTDEVKVNVVYGGVGAIKESDITLAAASQGMVLGFGVRPDTNARAIAERQRVEIRTYSIIYEAVDDVRQAMEGLLKPEAREKILGRAHVRELFKVSKVGVIAGCRVTEGRALRAAQVRVLRDSVQVYDGRVASLRHYKNDVREVDTGLECGVGIEGFNDVKQGDIIEFYQIEQIARTLSQPTLLGKRPLGGGSVTAHP